MFARFLFDARCLGRQVRQTLIERTCSLGARGGFLQRANVRRQAHRFLSRDEGGASCFLLFERALRLLARLGEGCHLERELADSLLFDRVDSPRLDIRQIRTSTGFAHEFASVLFELVDTCVDSREVAGSLAMNAEAVTEVERDLVIGD